VELGFEELVFHGPGADQRRFLELFTRDVLPRLHNRWPTDSSPRASWRANA
jgi:coenzyme F420-dependent glucose-6-phosphate dehydrogenase